MMYHFMFGLRGASAVAVAPPAAGACCPPSALGPAQFFSSSCIWVLLFLSALCLICLFRLLRLMLERVEQRRDDVLDEIIDHGEVERKNEDGDDDYRRRGLD